MLNHTLSFFAGINCDLKYFFDNWLRINIWIILSTNKVNGIKYHYDIKSDIQN